MAITLNSAGLAHAHALVAEGKVSTSAWEFVAADSDKMLGPDGDDWLGLAKWFLGVHSDTDEKTKGHFAYPFGKEGQVYRNAVVSAKGYAAQQKDAAVENACTSLLDSMDKKSLRGTQRAYSTLEIKAVDDDKRIITGIASTPSTDRMGDIVDPKGAKYALPIPLLWQHDANSPIGWITAATVTSKGIQITAQIASGVTQAIEDCWAMIKAGLVRGLSIGFRGLETEDIAGTWGVKFTSWEWLELSAVTIPANADASIQTIKTFDNKQLAASGKQLPKVVRLESPPPGASGTKNQPATSRFFFDPKKANDMNIQEQINQYKATRASKQAAMDAIMAKSAESGATLDQAQSDEYDGLESEVAAIDSHLIRLAKHEKSLIAGAKSVEGANTVERGSEARGGGIITIKPNVPKGMAFARYVKTLAAAKGNLMQAAEMAKQYDDSTPEVSLVIRSAVAAGTTTDSAWAAPLVPYQQMASEFVELLRPQTILGKIQGFRRVPFKVKMPRQTGGSTIGWVGELGPKPVSALAFDSLSLDFTKTAGIVVISDELARLSTPSAEDLIQQDLIEQTAQFLDDAFINPAHAAVSGVSPAAVTNGASHFTASGTDEDALRNDIRKLLGFFTTGLLSAAGAVFVMTETRATAISLMVNPLGQPSFPGITANGGTLLGLPVIVSQTVTQTTAGSPPVTTDIIALIKPSEILLADDGGVTIDVSNQASLQMDSAPTNPPVAATVLVSLWQMNMIGIRAERWINWVLRRAAAVAYISGANYG